MQKSPIENLNADQLTNNQWQCYTSRSRKLLRIRRGSNEKILMWHLEQNEIERHDKNI